MTRLEDDLNAFDFTEKEAAPKGSRKLHGHPKYVKGQARISQLNLSAKFSLSQFSV
jgi:hypothetical protein